jgi:hypothetical protein
MRAIYSILLLLLSLAGCSSGPIVQAKYDAEVKRLCAIDGGVKVYETVKLPADHFDKYGEVHLPLKQNAKVNDKYFYVSSIKYLKSGNPEVWRLHFMVYRGADNKLLGEAIGYARRGGDISGPWHDSSFGCPEHSDISDLEKLIFIKSN